MHIAQVKIISRAQVDATVHLRGLEVKMLFSRSEGLGFKPPRGTLFKDFGTLYSTELT